MPVELVVGTWNMQGAGGTWEKALALAKGCHFLCLQECGYPYLMDSKDKKTGLLMSYDIDLQRRGEYKLLWIGWNKSGQATNLRCSLAVIANINRLKKVGVALGDFEAIETKSRPFIEVELLNASNKKLMGLIFNMHMIAQKNAATKQLNGLVLELGKLKAQKRKEFYTWFIVGDMNHEPPGSSNGGCLKVKIPSVATPWPIFWAASKTKTQKSGGRLDWMISTNEIVFLDCADSFSKSDHLWQKFAITLG